MIRRRSAITRSPLRRSGIDLKRSANKQLLGSRMFDSAGERNIGAWLQARERDGEIRNLSFQVTHTLYIGGGVSYCGKCEQRIAPSGARNTYSPRLDFQFEEPRCKNQNHASIGELGHNDNCWWTVYADAKSWWTKDSPQWYGYKDFAAIHGTTLRLYFPRGVVKEFS